MNRFDPSTYGDAFADVYDRWYPDAGETDAAVERLARLASPGGRLLELGVGTGRLAIPLAGRGLAVTGIDASDAMLERLHAKPGGDAVRCIVGDMAELHVGADAAFDVVYAACNTFFNLASEDRQRACVQRVAAVLAPHGRLVLELFVPDVEVAGRAHAELRPVRVTDDEVVVRRSRTDGSSQVVTGEHVHVSDSDVTVRPWAIRWATVAQLDELAQSAELALEGRDAGWQGERFDATSERHVSIYRRQRAS